MTWSQTSAELDWMLDDLVVRVDPVRKALVLSRDGLVMGASRNLDREGAEYLAALASGLYSLAVGAGPHMDSGPVRQAVVEFEQGLFFVMAAGAGSCLAVHSDAGSGAGLVTYEMTVLVKRVHGHLSTRPRATGPGAG